MKWIVRAYSIILLGYTGWRTYDFVSSQLPKTDISFWLSIAFLFASEAGLLLWHEISLNHTSTREQHYLSTWLTWIDFVGSLAAGVADMILRQTLIDGYQVPPALAQLLVYGLPIIMAANVAGVLLYQSNDSEAQLDRGKRELKFEIFNQALKELHDNKGQIAESMKSDIYREIKNDVVGKTAARFIRAAQQPEQLHPAPSKMNGKPAMAQFNAEVEALPSPLPVKDGKQ